MKNTESTSELHFHDRFRLLKFFNAGTSKDVDKVTNERIVLANIIFLTIAGITAVGYIADYKLFLQPLDQFVFDQISSFILMLISLGCYFLNLKGFFRLSKVLFTVAWMSLSFFLNPLIQGSAADYYFHYDDGIIFISILIQILFSIRKEPFLYSFFLLVSLAMIVFHQDYLTYFGTDDTLNEIVQDKYIELIPVYYWFLFL